MLLSIPFIFWSLLWVIYPNVSQFQGLKNIPFPNSNIPFSKFCRFWHLFNVRACTHRLLEKMTVYLFSCRSIISTFELNISAPLPPILFLGKWPQNSGYQKGYWTLMHQEDDVVLIKFSRTGHLLPASKNNEKLSIKVGVNPSLKKEMWLLMHLITKKTCTKMYKSIHFWNQKNQMNPMVATDFGKIMQFFRNASVTMVTIEFFLDSITKIWFY